MDTHSINLLLADDDLDDCLFFREALEELPLKANLTTVHDGEQLIQYLTQTANQLPSLLFLDLNMPRKNGFECLAEIRNNENLKALPVVMYSTSAEPQTVDILYRLGAQYYICKPTEFSTLKNVIYTAITYTLQTLSSKPEKENFVLKT